MGLLRLRGVAEAGGDAIGFCGDAGGTGVGSGVAVAAGVEGVGLDVAVAAGVEGMGLDVTVAAGGSGVGVGVAGEVPTCCASTSARVGSEVTEGPTGAVVVTPETECAGGSAVGVPGGATEPQPANATAVNDNTIIFHGIRTSFIGFLLSLAPA